MPHKVLQHCGAPAGIHLWEFLWNCENCVVCRICLLLSDGFCFLNILCVRSSPLVAAAELELAGTGPILEKYQVIFPVCIAMFIIFS